MNWLKKNWKSILTGALTLGITGYSVYRDPAILADPKTLATALSGIGLIALNESGSAKPPQAPAQ